MTRPIPPPHPTPSSSFAIMHSTRIDALVDDLVAHFETGLQFYTQWQRRRVKENHYRRSGITPRAAAAGTSALATSFTIGSRIKESYEIGYAILGADFAAGDGEKPFLFRRRSIRGRLT
jgi:hypothetical protein